jgi:site-specific DNA-methyltransferase (adenine-specific)
MSADLRLGRWQDVLSDVTCDALIVDAPYSERTHKGHDYTHSVNVDAARKKLGYEPFSHADVASFVAHWSGLTRGWFVSITDDELAPVWKLALEKSGRYAFAQVPYVAPGSRVRLSGDGPSSWTTWVVVARPKNKTFSTWGTLPGAYILPPGEGGHAVMGGKPLWLMRAIVRDYSRPGDLICDPCAGGGTTLLAALTEGRRAVGAEMDPKHYEIARKRLAKGFTPPLFPEAPPAPTQLKMGEE